MIFFNRIWYLLVDEAYMNFETILVWCRRVSIITLFGFENDEQWYFSLERNEMAMAEFNVSDLSDLYDKFKIV